MKTVRDHFERAFPGFVYPETRDPGDLESMPLESTCGDECRATIDAGAKLAAKVRLAYGDDRPDLIADIGGAVVAACGVFICG